MEPGLIGVDLNATRLRAVSGLAGCLPARPVVWEGGGPEGDLPLVLSLEQRNPEVGLAGLRLCRRLPHLTCQGFLPFLGETREWRAGRHRLDAFQALSLFLHRVHPLCLPGSGMTAAIPSYLTRTQVTLLTELAADVGLPLLGTVTTPLAAVLAAEPEWSGLVLVADVDEHALTWSAVAVEPGQAQVLAEQVLPAASLRAWKERLLNVIAERCILHSRRDPRESATAEQMLFEQLDRVMAAQQQDRMAEVHIQGGHWYQNLILRPEELAAFCAPLVRSAIQGMRAAVSAAEPFGPPGAVLATPAAGRLPGLLAAVREYSAEPTVVTALGPDDVASAVHRLAAGFQEGSLPRGHLDVAIRVRQPAPAVAPRKSSAPAAGPDSGLQAVSDDFSLTIDD